MRKRRKNKLSGRRTVSASLLERSYGSAQTGGYSAKNDNILGKHVSSMVGRALVYTSLGLLGILILGMLFPVASSSSSALGEDVTMTANLNTKTTAHLYSTIALSTSGQVDLELTPKASGSMAVSPAVVSVATNNTTGYALYLSTVDGKNTLAQVDSSLQYTNDSADYAISALQSPTTAGDYIKNKDNLNTWAYALTKGNADSNTVYQGLGTQNTMLDKVNSTSSHDTYNLNIAVAVDTTLPAGDYRNGLVITAVANPIVLTGFNSIYYMQDMTATVCESAKDGETAQLVDKRDNNIYWVAKLKDGNCWMTQNLALDLSTEVALTPNDSDVSESWTPKVSTEKGVPSSGGSASHRSWNLGKVVWAYPTTSNSCGNIMTNNVITACSAYKNVETWSPTYVSVNATAINITDNTYDAHYLIGNYYQHDVAVAESKLVEDDLTGLANNIGSICPKGWMLPKSGTGAFGTDDDIDSGIAGSFAYLLKQYGLATSDTSGILSSTSSDGGVYNIATKPLYFTISGAIEPNVGMLVNSSNGYVQSGTMVNNSRFYTLAFGANVRPMEISATSNGMPVRCVAR